MALAALAMMVNDHGHTTTCWRDKETARRANVEAVCMSEACAMTRRVLGLEGFADDECDRVRAVLNRTQGDAKSLVDAALR
jgi:hypothetical protein